MRGTATSQIVWQYPVSLGRPTKKINENFPHKYYSELANGIEINQRYDGHGVAYSYNIIVLRNLRFTAIDQSSTIFPKTCVFRYQRGKSFFEGLPFLLFGKI